MRLNSMDIHVDRQYVRIGHDVILFPRRDVDVLLAQTQHRGAETRRLLSEVESDRKLNLLRFACRAKMELHNHVTAGIQSPCQFGRLRGNLPWSPSEKIAVGIPGSGRNQSVISRRWIL